MKVISGIFVGVSARTPPQRIDSVRGSPLCCVGFLLCLVGTPVSGVDVQGVRWDGTKLAGTWAGSKDGTHVDVQTGNGLISERVDHVATLTLPTSFRAPFGTVAFYLADGGVLFGAMTGREPDAVKAQTPIGDVTLAWSNLAAIRLAEPSQFKRANELFQEALRDRSPSQDVLISREHAEVKVLQGRLESLSPEGGVFQFAGESRNFQTGKLFAIVFAAGATSAGAKPAVLELADGSSFSGTLLSADTAGVKLQASFGAALEVPVADVRRIRFRSDRVVYLSDLKPKSERMEGVLHGAWPVATDRSVMGSPISIGGTLFERGLGVHSRAELTYALGGEFERFAATAGIDDAVRPLGSVNMLVVGDGKTLFESGPLSGVDPPRDILVDVAGVQAMTLIVDYGEGLDASDHADWGDARLLRPRKPGSTR